MSMRKKEIFFSTILGAAAGACVVGEIAKKKLHKVRKMSDKHLALFLMMDQWVRSKQEGKDLINYFQKKHYDTIAIYGMSYAGKRLLKELEGSDIKVKYGIDKNAESIDGGIDIVHPEGTLEEVDAVIVTSIFFMSEIEAELSERLICPILSLEDILYQL